MRGGCSCGAVTYRLTDAPMIVHCCHCSWCQTEIGSAFVINAVIERDRLEVTGEPEAVMTPSASGKGQEIFRCPACRVALWSHYGSAGRKAAFVRVGTMEAPSACPPDVHIFTSTKLSWVTLPEDVPAYAEFYPDPGAVWTAEAQGRWKVLMAASN
jgi:hypothetical protein